MTANEIKEIQEQINIAKLDPNHTGLKKLKIFNIGDLEVIGFQPVKMYNMGYGDPHVNGELLVYNHLKDKIKTLFDVGARDDTYYLTSNDISYFLFEPNPDFYKNLQNNIKDKNANQNLKVKSYNIGLGPKDNKMTYYHDTQSFVSGNDDKKTLIDVRTISSIFKENNLDSIDYLKLDVEGFEYDVLQGALDVLDKIKFIQFEYGNYSNMGMEPTIFKIFNLLTNNGFNVFTVVADNGLVRIPELKDHNMMCNYLVFRDRDIQLVDDIINLKTLYSYYV